MTNSNIKSTFEEKNFESSLEDRDNNKNFEIYEVKSHNSSIPLLRQWGDK